SVRTVFTHLVETGLPVTVLPHGSANNIAGALGLADRPLEQLVEAWDAAEPGPFHLAELRAPDRDSLLLQAVGGGLFAESLARGEQLETDGVDKVELGLRLLRRLVDELPAQRWEIELDGDTVSGDYLAVEAMITGETGPSVPLAPSVSPMDPAL